MNALQFLQEDDGKFSATRLALLLWIVGLLVVWTIGSIHNVSSEGELLEIPFSVITLVGIFVTGKTVQKFGEEKMNSSSSSDTTTITTAKQARSLASEAPTA